MSMVRIDKNYDNDMQGGGVTVGPGLHTGAWSISFGSGNASNSDLPQVHPLAWLALSIGAVWLMRKKT